MTNTNKPSMWRRLWAPVRRAWKRHVRRFHESLFAWHSKTFYPLADEVSAQEMRYLQTCFALAESFQETPESGYDEYSYYTYSHRVHGDQVNSSRFAYGSVAHPALALEAAMPVLEERGITVDPYFLEENNSLFYGLGWDLLAGHLKVYFRVLRLTALPQSSLQALYEQTLVPNPRDEGLISFTFVGDQLHEEKVYVYPKPEAEKYGEIFPGAKGRALMATTRRGTITQYDVSHVKHWKERINPAGVTILQAYAQKGYALDTIAMQDQDQYTLYFPGELSIFRRRL